MQTTFSYISLLSPKTFLSYRLCKGTQTLLKFVGTVLACAPYRFVPKLSFAFAALATSSIRNVSVTFVSASILDAHSLNPVLDLAFIT